MRAGMLGWCALVVLVGSTVVSAQPRQERVVLQLPYRHMFNYAGFYAAEIKGFYADEGLEVDILEGDQKETAADVVLRGEAHYGVQGPELLHLRAQQKPVVVLAALFQHSPWAFIVRKDSGIRQPEDLIGRTVAIEQNARDSEFRALFRKRGINESELNLVRNSWNLEDLIEGRVDARASYVNDTPYWLKKAGVEYHVIRPADYGVSFCGDCLFTSEDELDQHPERVAAFHRATLKGWRYALRNQGELIDHILLMDGVRARGLTREFLEFEAASTVRIMATDLVEIGHLSPTRWETMAEELELGRVDLAGFLYEPKHEHPWLWWSIAIACAFTLFVGLVLLWNIQLRTRVDEATESLQQSEERYRVVIEGTRDIVWEVDANLRYAYISPQCAMILGYEPEDLVGEHVVSVIAPPEAERFVRLMERFRERPAPFARLENHEVRRDGEIRVMESSGAPFYDANGKLAGYRGITRDITERKRAERGLRESREQLRQLAARLQEVREEERSAIAREIHDEFGQALTGLKIDLALLGNKLPSEHQKRTRAMTGVLDVALDSARRLASALRPPVLDDLGLEAAVEAHVAQFADRTGIPCELTMDTDGLPRDKERDTQVFRILQEAMTNVARHATAREVRVTLRGEDDRLLLEVRDDGCGIRTEDVAASQSLGLLGMRERASSLGGRIDVVQAKGGGTLVRVGVPRRPVAETT